MTAPQGETKGGEATPRGRPIFVGRGPERQRLQAALRELGDGNGRLILIAGEPGVGKTCLAEEAARLAKERGANVVWGRCWEGEGAPDLWPWLQVIRVCLRAVDDDTLRALVGPHGSELTALVAPLRARQLGVSSPPESPAARFRLFNAIAHFLDGYARRAPLVVILDDLDRADAASLLLLQFFTQEQRERAILLIGTYRDPGGSPNRALTQTVVEAMREPGSERLVLERLAPEGTVAMLRALLEVEPADAVSEVLHLRTGGNPLLLRECAHQLHARGAWDAAAAAELAISDELREVIAQRLAPLPEAHRAVLRLAAVMKGDIRSESLESLVGMHAGLSATEARDATIAALSDTEKLGLVRRSGAGMYQFAHGMVREILCDEAPAVELATPPPAADAVRVDESPAEAKALAENETVSRGTAHVFRREGEYWTITYSGRTCRMRDIRGMAHIAFLLRHPGQAVHVSELIQLGGASSEGMEGPVGRFDEGVTTRLGLGDAGAVLDARAKAEYRRRLDELRAEVEQAHAFNDSGRAERAQFEIDKVTEALATAIGLGGRDRRMASDAERARVNVARAIARVLARMTEVHPELAHHLDQSIRKGTFCTYVPDASITEPWDC